ncbi:nucleolar protein dao-5 isoform X1 [Drosophila kikkawai]|uniref:Nucleolar protein dao-5 isoform X1 n=1 Tax=Drosophila kikkawai TaxID=30033 RepID=A0A6P4HQK9_DROKI|nr:nucleolar and coiled-body phosphoprotein 1 isoform X1 [Drosophila kikkawai]
MELFDMVKAAPPPQTISAPERTSPPSPIPPDSPDAIAATDAVDDADLLQSAVKDEEGNNVEDRKYSPKRHIDSPPLPGLKSDESLFKTPQNIQKYKQDDIKIDEVKPKTDDEDDVVQQVAGDKSENLEGNDSDGSLDGYPKTLPTKTKAQQKMFSDLPDQSASLSCVLREFSIRVRRLKQSEIDSACASLAKSKFASSETPSRKRGRPRKSAEDKKSPSPAKKLKISPTAKIHIKVPLPSGAKKRALANLARTHTPPPILSSRIKAKPKPKQKPKGLKVSPALVQRYGRRVFSCVVNVKKLKWPSKSGERPRPRRSNLSVSFNESVEILGSNEGSPRRYTFGAISSKSPKPTRLQRVDATGNVLEDIALTANMLVSPSSAPSGSRGKGKRRSCNGSPQLKRPHQRIPLSGLASLRLDDGPRSDGDDDEEYIVPNELPGMQRPGTPTPKKKKISYTTTISDDEDEKAPPQKKPKDAKEAPKKEAKTKPNSKKVEKFTSLKESVLQSVVPQGKPNEIVKGKEQKESGDVPGKDDQKDAETEVQNVTETTANDGEKPDTPRPVDILEDNPQETEEASTVETDVGAGEESVEENADKNSQEKTSVGETTDKKSEEKSKSSVGENAEKNPVRESKSNVEENGEKSPVEESKAAEEACETSDMSALELEEPSRQLRDDKTKPEKVGDVEVFREMDTPPSQPPLPLNSTEENPDDVLEIQTSLEDVRELHTPFSSQQSTPQASKRVRLDSGDSDCSFKSANEPNKETQLEHGRGGEAVGKEDAASGEDKSIIDSAELMTPPKTVNGCDPTTSEPTVFYSPIEAMPTLDDEVLGQLVEPDFQLNSSRHAISRGTLDDIMTALES